MKVTFSDKDLQEFCTTGKSDKSAYKRFVKDKAFMVALARVLTTLISASNTSSLKGYSFLHYEKLKGDRAGQSSVRIANNRVERLIFTENESGIEIHVIELNTQHYGRKK